MERYASGLCVLYGIGKQVVAYLHDALFVTHKNNIGTVLHDKFQILAFCHRSELCFKYVRYALQAERGNVHSLFSVFQPKETQQGVEHGYHPLGGLQHASRMVLDFCRTAFPYQFRIAVYGGQRCTQLMGDSVHRLLSGGGQLPVHTIRFAQLRYQRGRLTPVAAYPSGVAVDDYV